MTDHADTIRRAPDCEQAIEALRELCDACDEADGPLTANYVSDEGWDKLEAVRACVVVARAALLNLGEQP